ncbi:hypothetical protein TanjilG_05501 [Lupinus angustifolius]|uniref:Uncharacterized protein n=1 Tax=Lupinus angustifolius TaxID=3871 RepID=A0A1J7IR07_LUPAN|nr:hypothetical protein TanjilG_05501 [Lupinus angustifolius]
MPKHKSTKINDVMSKLKVDVPMPETRLEIGAPRLAHALPMTVPKWDMTESGFRHLGHCLCIMIKTHIPPAWVKAKATHQDAYISSIKTNQAKAMHTHHAKVASSVRRNQYQAKLNSSVKIAQPQARVAQH